jgi:hypothetical protein
MMANPRSVWSHVQIKRQIMTALRGPEEGGPVGFLVVAIGKLRFPWKVWFRAKAGSRTDQCVNRFGFRVSARGQQIHLHGME